MSQVVRCGYTVSEPYNFWLGAQTHICLTSWCCRIGQVDEVTEETGEEGKSQTHAVLWQCAYYLKEMTKTLM